MINLVLAGVSVLLWGGAYGAYFGPDLVRWLRRRRQAGAPARQLNRLPPARPRRAVPTPPYVVSPTGASALVLRPPVVQPAPPPPSNVIPFPRKPRA